MKYSHAIAMAVVVFFLGSMFGLYYGAITIMQQTGFGGSFAQGWEAARIKLATVGQYRGEVNSLAGSIKEIKDNKITFETALINPLDDESLKIRTAVIDEKTEVILKKMKSEEQYQKDINDNAAAIASKRAEIETLMQSQKECVGGPSVCAGVGEITRLQRELSALTEASGNYTTVVNPELSQIKAGYDIYVVSKVDEKKDDKTQLGGKKYGENIALKKEFTASRIEITEFSSPVKK